MISKNYSLGLILFYLFISLTSAAQQSTFNGWFSSNHKQKLSSHWALVSDIQFRSTDRFNYLQTMLIRPGFQYKLTDKHFLAAGYAYFKNREITNDIKSYKLEHRIWEQYVLFIKLRNKEVNNRFRLEQRFIEAGERFQFSQRLRYLINMQIPLTREEQFKKGGYVVLQNELFLNIQNKKNANNRFFDQNRAYLSLGFRFNKKVDVETGYIFRFQLTEESVRNHILQVLLKTTL